MRSLGRLILRGRHEILPFFVAFIFGVDWINIVADTMILPARRTCEECEDGFNNGSTCRRCFSSEYFEDKLMHEEMSRFFQKYYMSIKRKITPELSTNTLFEYSLLLEVFKFIISAQRRMANISRQLYLLSMEKVIALDDDDINRIDDAIRVLLSNRRDAELNYIRRRELLYNRIGGERMFPILDEQLDNANMCVEQQVRTLYPRA